MSTVTISHQSFSFSLFTQLVRRLRHANARYNLIAYQCRHTQHPTYHAKRQAYRAGLRIDTSKARAAWSEDHVSFSPAVCEATPRPPPVLDSTADGLAWAASEVETESEEDSLPNPWPKPENIVWKQSTTPCLSPLDLGLRTVDDPDTYDLPFHGPVPGAPRWRPKPLPVDDLECVSGMATMTNELLSSSSSGANYTYDPVWRGVMGTHVSDLVSLPVGVVYGSALPEHHLKRKLRDVDMDESAIFSRHPGIGVPDARFSGAWWSEGQRRRGDL